MNTSAGPRVFISHATADNAHARRLRDALLQRGLHVWLDEADIRSGETLNRAVEEGIRGCDFIVVLVSADANASDWVRHEIEFTLADEKALKGRPKLLAIRLDDTPLPQGLEDRLYVDLRPSEDYPKALHRLVASLYRWLNDRRPTEEVPGFVRKLGRKLTPRWFDESRCESCGRPKPEYVCRSCKQLWCHACHVEYGEARFIRAGRCGTCEQYSVMPR